LQDKVQSLETENSRLRSQLKLQSSHHPTSPVALPRGIQEPETHSVPATQPAGPIDWASIVTRPAKKIRPPTPKKVEAISRCFNPTPTGPQGFQYIYLHRSRRLTHVECRKNLRLLGAEPSRILDIMFPARNVVGLLVHIQYQEEFLQILAKANVKPINSEFDPTDGKHVADPKYASLSNDERNIKAAELHRDRCLHTLEFLASTRRPLLPVARDFLNNGWISDEDFSEVLNSTPT
ncbi:hypothetical protein BDF20DRAFT_803873, partial [Mycotypha africana]|uniref:uncharacterized protein n=1 Tax=Mycotypha africana TaxID=64632 RepID=UPI002301B0BD